MPDSVHFELDRRERDDFARLVVPRNSKLALTSLSIAFALNFCNGVLHIARPDRTFASVTIWVVLAALSLLCICALFFIRNMDRPEYLAGDVVDISFSADGITIDGSPPRKLMWGDIGGARDVLGAIVVMSRGRMLVLPKRAFDDGGRAVWAYLEEHLIGKRLLRRLPGSRSITATAIRQRS